MTTSLTEALLAVPTAPRRPTNPETGFTQQVEVKDDRAEVTVRTPASEAGTYDEQKGNAETVLRGQGLDPDDWTVTGFRSSEWTMANGDVGTSVRFSFARRGTVASAERPPLDELIAAVKRAPRRSAARAEGEHGFILGLGDMQFGKIDGDGVEGTLARTLSVIDRAAELLPTYRKRFDIGHVHIAWLGDHVEGFVSQGGANVWRTPLTLNEQIRLTRRVMLYALEAFAGSAGRVSMVAVPGNHGEPQRFAGKGVTRYDDSHDTESLIAVADAAKLNEKAYGHVEFYVPETDEMTVVLDVAGTRVGHVHGHQYRPGKHFEWLEKQAFAKGSLLRDLDLLLAGHLHHFHVDTRSGCTFAGVPALESESTWYRHSQGVTGDPGAVIAITRNGLTSPMEVIR